LGECVARTGLMRTVTWWSLFKMMSVRDWVVFLERFGIPYVTGTYTSATPDSDKAVLERVVRDFGREGAAVFHETCKVAIETIQIGEVSAHSRMATFCNEEISKAVKGSMLTTEVGGNGSYAQASVHQDASFNRIQLNAARPQDVFYRAVSVPFVHYNGMKCEPPRLKIRVVREVDSETRLRILTGVWNMGVALDQDQIREEMALKSPVGGKDSLPLPPDLRPMLPAPAEETPVVEPAA